MARRTGRASARRRGARSPARRPARPRPRRRRTRRVRRPRSGTSADSVLPMTRRCSVSHLGTYPTHSGGARSGSGRTAAGTCPPRRRRPRPASPEAGPGPSRTGRPASARHARARRRRGSRRCPARRRRRRWGAGTGGPAPEPRCDRGRRTSACSCGPPGTPRPHPPRRRRRRCPRPMTAESSTSASTRSGWASASRRPASAVVPWPITTHCGASSASITAYSDSPSRSGVTTSVSMPSASTRSRHAPMAATRPPAVGGVAERLDLGTVQGRPRVAGAGQGDDDHPPAGALGDGCQAAVPGRHAQVDAGLQHGAQVGRARRLDGDHEDLQGAAGLGDHEPAGVLGDDQHLDVVGAGDGLERRAGRRVRRAGARQPRRRRGPPRRRSGRTS